MMNRSSRKNCAGLATFLVLVLVTRTTSVVVRPRRCHGAPKHIHIAVGTNPTREMTISFASTWSYPGYDAPLGGVHLGLSPDKLDRFVEEQEFPVQYQTNHSNPKLGQYFSPYQHHILVDGLEPSTTYYYVVVVGSRDEGTTALRGKPLRDHPSQHTGDSLVAEMEIRSEKAVEGEEDNGRRLAPPPYDGFEFPCTEGHKVRSFRTAPETSTGPVTFAIIGDIGQFEHSQETLLDMAKRQDSIDAVMLVGDLAYTELDHRRWDTFFDFLDDFSIFDEVPLQIATGNHDIDKQENRNEIFEAYETRFRMPQLHPAELGVYDGPLVKLNMEAPPYPLPYEWGNAYYSFTYGPAKHIVISAYSSMEPGSTQYDWIMEELASVDRSVTPWVLVTIHVPIYNTFSLHPHDPQIFAAQQHLEPLLVLYQVNMVFTGHIHAYQRTANVAMGKLDKSGPIHITVGAGGRRCDAPFKNGTAEEWIMTRDGSYYGYGLFNIYNETHAEWRWIPLSPSEEHSYNYVKKDQDHHLPMIDHDAVIVKNQYFH